MRLSDVATAVAAAGDHRYYWKAVDTQSLYSRYLERSRCARHYTYISIYTYIYTMEVSVWMQGYCLDAGDTM